MTEISPTDSGPELSPDMRVALLAITRGGARLGQKLCSNLNGCQLYVSSRYSGQGGSGCHSFEPSALKELVAGLWKSYDGFVMIMAAGIVVRMIAPLLESKDIDPAVVVMDDAGRFAIPVLSGHLGGGNELAERCAFVTGARAVITTATDVNNLPSFDMLAKEQGWEIDDISRVKHLNTLLLDDRNIAVVDPTGQARSWLHGRGRISFHGSVAEALDGSADGIVLVTNRHIPPRIDNERLLVLRPKNLVLGVGCNRGTPADEIGTFIGQQLKRLFLSPKSIRCIATVSAKRDEPGLVACAGQFHVPLHCFDSEELNRIPCPSPPSEHAMAAVGAVGVAEPAALLASNGGKLLLNKVKSANVTLAVAEYEQGACP